MAREPWRRKHHVQSIPDLDAKGEDGCRAKVGRNEKLVGHTNLLSAGCLTFALVELLLGTLCFFQVCTAQRYPMRAWLDLALCWCKRLRQFAAISSKPGRHRCTRMRQDFESSPVAAPSALVPRLGGQLCIFGIQPLEGTSGTCGPCRRWYSERGRHRIDVDDQSSDGLPRQTWEPLLARSQSLSPQSHAAST